LLALFILRFTNKICNPTTTFRLYEINKITLYILIFIFFIEEIKINPHKTILLPVLC
jgi:hypothetical protein